MMNQTEIRERILEFVGANPNTGNDEAELLEAALFIEEEFRLFLSDDEICEKNLGTHRAIEKFVIEKICSLKPCAGSVE